MLNNIWIGYHEKLKYYSVLIFLRRLKDLKIRSYFLVFYINNYINNFDKYNRLKFFEFLVSIDMLQCKWWS